ncbi:hypothetical protein E1B28_004414 [Marasmius oreades]|uniref:DUF302 domain-containing protein n=1 Tax=Marasmius oreades TaxID=181124 RepID=A0A9P7UYN3_9AGAR|nr:uncharacterized protein E1B28_004414 [Marasmius oreades]KAG7097021.1 hypothetical protein E1B28_004414 [Marasmius oreades]
MSVVKTVIPLTAQLVQYATTLSPQQVISRIEDRINREGSMKFMSSLPSITSREELEETIRGVTQGNDFMLMQSMRHDNWLKFYDEKTPLVAVYSIGNPMIAKHLVSSTFDLRAAYNIPPRLLILEKEDRTGTYVLYYLPSSVMSLNGDEGNFVAAVRALDEKLERLVIEVTKVD